MYCSIWEYNVIEEHVDDFVKAYKVNGLWCKLFVKSEGYIKTDFFEDEKDTKRFVTIDYWKSKELYEAFLSKHEDEYEALDDQCDGYTDIEVFVGNFNLDVENSNSINFYDLFDK